MSADEAASSAALQQQQLGDDAGIPQLPGGPGGEGGPHTGSQENAGYGEGSFEQQQQQQQGEAGNRVLTEEEKTARKIFVGGLNRNTTGRGLLHYSPRFFAAAAT